MVVMGAELTVAGIGGEGFGDPKSSRSAKMMSATQKARCRRYKISVYEPARTHEAVGGALTFAVDVVCNPSDGKLERLGNSKRRC